MPNPQPQPHSPRGFADNPQRAIEAGRRGGLAVMRKYGARFHREIGKLGGEALKAEHGPEYYAEIGRRGGLARAARMREPAG